MRDLIQRIKNEDLTAVEELYQKVHSVGLKVAVSYVGTEGLEEDMFHEAFIKALENLDKFDNSREFQPWFDVILANTCKSYLRKKKPSLMPQKDDSDDVEVGYDEISALGNPEECWDQKELREIIMNLLDGLSTEQKDAIILYYYQGAPVSKIAEYQNCSVDTVKSRLFQGRNKLKDAIEAYEKKSNIKLHSIGVVTALFVFFKSSMGNAYAQKCSIIVSTATAATVAGETAKMAGAVSTAGEVAKVAGVVSTAGKVAAMSTVTKAIIGTLAAAAVIGGVSISAVLLKEKTVVDNQPSVEQSVESTDIQEEIENTVENVEENTTEIVVENTEEPESIISIEDAISVEIGEDGIRRISVNIGILGIRSANGGVVITKTEEGFGAIDYDGNIIVPNQYDEVYDFMPDEKGYFMLGSETEVFVFDKKGNIVYTVQNPESIRVSEGYVSYTTSDYMACLFDIENKQLYTSDFYAARWQSFSQAMDTIDSKCYFAFSCGPDIVDLSTSSVSRMTTDGKFEECGMTSGLWLYSSPYGGWCFGEWLDVDGGAFYLYDEDFSDFIRIEMGRNYGLTGFCVDGNQHVNKGTIMVFSKDEKCVLCDFSDFEKNYSKWDMDTNYIKDSIIATYDDITLSATGICYAKNEDVNFYMSEDGTTIVDEYVDHGPFVCDYAAVLDENGKVYVIDAQFNVISSGYEATDVGDFGGEPGYVNEEIATILVVEQ